MIVATQLSFLLQDKEPQALLEEVFGSNVGAESKDKIVTAFKRMQWILKQLQEDRITLRRLRRVLGFLGEANQKYLERKQKANAGIPSQKPSSGHGRNGHDAYRGAEEIEVPHESLKAGAPCPVVECEGKLYQTDPSVVVNVKGSPMAAATKYRLEKLRCALCGEVFTAPAPTGVNPLKSYDEGFAAMLMVNKYFMAVPFFRQQALQEMLGVPLLASTQWDIIRSYEPILKKAYEALEKDAAQAICFHIDDTKARVLEALQRKEQQGTSRKEERAVLRQGCCLATSFGKKPKETSSNTDAEIKRLHAKISQLTVEVDFLEEASKMLGLGGGKK